VCRNGRALTVPQMAIVLAPYIIRPTSQSGEIGSGSGGGDDLGDTLIEPSKCIDSPKPIGFPLTPRRREIVRSDWFAHAPPPTHSVPPDHCAQTFVVRRVWWCACGLGLHAGRTLRS
jgi:hypothetical protein